MRDPLALLLRDLPRHLGAFRLGEARSRPWASATFNGARHRLALTLDGGDAAVRGAALARRIGEAEFRLPGHIVADLAVTARNGAEMTIEALTIEAC